MAKMATAVAAAAMQIGVNKEDVRQHTVFSHQPNKMRQGDPLSNLEGEMKNTITSTRKSTVTAPGGPDNPPEPTQVSHNNLQWQPNRTTRHPYLKDRIPDGPTKHQSTVSSINILRK
jgi:hypothetical protein